jgi:hypothetical protein
MMAAAGPGARHDATPRQRRNAYINVKGRPLLFVISRDL